MFLLYQYIMFIASILAFYIFLVKSIDTFDFFLYNISIERRNVVIIQSDWHIHSEYSYDAKNPLKDIIDSTTKQGLKAFGITDHLNYNDDKFIGDIKNSVKNVSELAKEQKNMVIGVELTPVSKHIIDYCSLHGTREGYIEPTDLTPYGYELALSKEELIKMGVRYAVCASHWRLDKPKALQDISDVDGLIKDLFKQQMWLASDERTTILGHPWYHGRAAWYQDFSIIPKSMNNEIACAVKQNGKCVECNHGVICSPKTSEKFRYQYAEFLRELFEMGIRITYGSDAHEDYDDHREEIERYLSHAGFKEGDFYTLTEKDFWL